MTQRFDPTDFRNALGSFVTGVTIVTAHGPEGDVGVTANSFNSVSLEPPLVLWSLARTARSRETFELSEHFAVHVLATDQQELSNRFARSGENKFDGIDVTRGAGNVALLPGCAACFQCRTAYRYDGGDHIIFVGEVVDFEQSALTPLAFHSGQYAVAARKAEPLAPATATPPPDPDAAPDGSFGEDFMGYLVGRSYFQLFGQLAQDRQRLGVSTREYFVISTLAVRSGMTLDELISLLGYTGYVVDEALITALSRRNLVSISGPLDNGGQLSLTPSGQRVALELIAVAKAAESDALSEFSADEQHVLKQLLKRFIQATDPGLPSLWRQAKPGSEPAA